jgi:hypothetical protein
MDLFLAAAAVSAQFLVHEQSAAVGIGIAKQASESDL